LVSSCQCLSQTTSGGPPGYGFGACCPLRVFAVGVFLGSPVRFLRTASHDRMVKCDDPSLQARPQYVVALCQRGVKRSLVFTADAQGSLTTSFEAPCFPQPPEVIESLDLLILFGNLFHPRKGELTPSVWFKVEIPHFGTSLDPATVSAFVLADRNHPLRYRPFAPVSTCCPSEHPLG